MKVVDVQDALSEWQDKNFGYPDEVRLYNWPSDLPGYVLAGKPVELFGMSVKFDSSLKPGEIAFRTTSTPNAEMNLDERIPETLDAMYLHTDDEKYHVEQIKQLLRDVLMDFSEYCHENYTGCTQTSPEVWEYGYKNEVVNMAEAYTKKEGL